MYLAGVAFCSFCLLCLLILVSFVTWERFSFVSLGVNLSPLLLYLTS